MTLTKQTSFPTAIRAFMGYKAEYKRLLKAV